MSDNPKNPQVVAFSDVLIRRYIYDDGSVRLKVSGPKFARATCEDTLEFVINAIGLVVSVVKSYRDDLDREEVDTMVKEMVEDTLEAHEFDRFEVIWPRSGFDDPTSGGSMPQKP